MLRLTAEYADITPPTWIASAERATELWANVEAACAEVGRDPKTLEFTAFMTIQVLAPGETPSLFGPGIAGSVAHLAAELRRFRDAGMTHLIARFDHLGVAAIERFAPVMAMLDRD